MNWELINVRAVADHHSDFELPPEKDVENLESGDYAKLLFRFERPNPNAPDAERMWVQVDGRHECGHYGGRLSNDPLYAPLSLGDPVEFGPEHILAFMKKDKAVVGHEDINWVKGDQNDPNNWKSDPRKN